MIVNHISTAKLAKKNDICKFKCKNAYFFMETVSRKSGISYKQTARPLRVALFLYCILYKDYFLAYARLLLSLRTIISLLRSPHPRQLG